MEPRSKSALPLTFEYKENMKPPDRGFVLDRMFAYLDGVEVGYLSVEYVPKPLYKKFIPTIFHYLEHFQGWSLGIKNGGTLDLNDVDFWRRVLSYHSRGFSWRYYNGDPPPVEQRLKDIKRVVKGRRLSLKQFVDWNVDKPKVGYIYVLPELRRQGIAVDLYVNTANKLAQRGLCLYASTLQQPGAAAAWSWMIANNYPITQEATKDLNHPMRYRLSYL